MDRGIRPIRTADITITSNARDVALDINHVGERVKPVLQTLVTAQGRILLAMIKKNVSGRPGPNTVTGDYRRSWSAIAVPNPLGGASLVGTSAPQGHRLEYGFMNKRDSLGRLFKQPAYPHLRPALLKHQPMFVIAVDRAMQAITDNRAFARQVQGR